MTDTTTIERFADSGRACAISGCNNPAARDGYCAGHHYLVDRFRSLERVMQRAGKLWRKTRAQHESGAPAARKFTAANAAT
jgi:hypothetical protein